MFVARDTQITASDLPVDGSLRRRSPVRRQLERCECVRRRHHRLQLPRWDPELHEKGENADLLAKVLLGVGGAAIIGGGVLVWMGYHSERDSSSTASLRVVPKSDGAMVFWTGAL